MNHSKIGQKGASVGGGTAGSAAHIAPDTGRLRRYDKAYAAISKKYWAFIGCSGVSAVAAILCLIGQHWICAVGALLASVFFVRKALPCRAPLATIRNVYCNGNLVAAVVLQSAPLQVACLAAMQFDGGPAVYGLQVFEDWLLPDLSIAPGTRFATVAFYGRATPPRSRYWGQFQPRALTWGTGDQEALRLALAALDEEDWQIISVLIKKAPSLRPGEVAFFDHALNFMETLRYGCVPQAPAVLK